MRKKESVYPSPSEWLKNNRKYLAAYAGEWIAFTNTGIIAHNKSGRITAQEARQTQLQYVLKYVHPLEIPRVIRLVPVRIRSLKNSKIQAEELILFKKRSDVV
jgi:hypothetical protein